MFSLLSCLISGLLRPSPKPLVIHSALKSYTMSEKITSNLSAEAVSTTASKAKALIALGSNMGRSPTHIYSAFIELLKVGEMIGTSFLYKSAPMYYTDQPAFFNAVCEIQTDLEPLNLLAALKDIEAKVGRTATFRNGPRVLDLDIVSYGNIEMQHEKLVIPHPRLHERNFVLKPLLDLDPGYVHPSLNQNIASLWQDLCNNQRLQTDPTNEENTMQKVIPCFNHQYKSFRYLNLETGLPLVMGILNITPDSFSDGGKYLNSIDAAVSQVEEMLLDGANIIDIGGESTRPHAKAITLEEELSRIMPVIRAIRERGIDCLISVDTRKSQVAKEAILAGADIINDVSGGDYDLNMFAVVGELGVPYIAMHMRGDPKTMLNKEHSTYNQVSKDVTNELLIKLRKLDQHIPRWLQIVDPGIGFAKNAQHNSDLLRPNNMRKLKVALGDRPLLVGASRKRFLQHMHDTELTVKRQRLVSNISQSSAPNPASPQFDTLEKDLATAGVCCNAILGGADILRVHNVKTARLVCDSFAFTNNL